jgi:hydrogenase maturation protease
MHRVKPTPSVRRLPHERELDNSRSLVAPPPNVVIGLGNEIAGDDGIGIHVARNLSRILQDRPEVEVVPLPWAGFALLDELVGRQQAAIIDCICTGIHPPGTIVRLDEKDFRGSVRLNSFHDINFSTVLKLGRKMGWQMPEQIAIWGIEGAEMDSFKEELSPLVWAAVNQVINEVLLFFDLNQNLHKTEIQFLVGASK